MIVHPATASFVGHPQTEVEMHVNAFVAIALAVAQRAVVAVCFPTLPRRESVPGVPKYGDRVDEGSVI